jgi:hypothetical protein
MWWTPKFLVTKIIQFNVGPYKDSENVISRFLPFYDILLIYQDN